MYTLAAALLLLAGVEGGGVPIPEPRSVPWDGLSTQLHTDAAANVRFAIPASGYLVEAHHLRSDRAGKVSDALVVSGAAGQLLTLDVLPNPEGLSLQGFFKAHLAFLEGRGTTTLWGVAGTATVPALLVDQPRTGQAFGQRLAVFALRGRVFKLACLERDDPTMLRLFERALESFAEARP